MVEEIAQREWHTTALVRITKACGAASVDPYRVRDFHVGDEVVMHQWGRAGRPVRRDDWWTSFDIDGAFIIKSENAEIIKIIDEVSPFKQLGPPSPSGKETQP